jgi:hypothetical protein
MMLRAHVPRKLRVRSSIQIASTRVSARAFLIVAGLIFVGGLMVVAGAELAKTGRVISVLILLALVVFELRCWGRSTREVARIMLRHFRRPRRLRLQTITVTLPAERPMDVSVRRPRWQAQA